MMRRGKVRLGLLLIAVLAVAGFGGYRYFFNRPGEAAIGLIPSDASMVFTLDTNPSEAQVQTFMKIARAMKREGLDESLQDLLAEFCGKHEIVRELRPYVTNNFAVAIWTKQTMEPQNCAVLVAIKNAGSVEEVLKSRADASADAGSNGYKLRDDLFLGVVDSYLVVATDAPTLARVRAVSDGSTQAMADLPAYAEARAALPPDANFMAFLSPQAINDFQKAASAGTPLVAKWLAFGAAVRADGIQMEYRGPVNAGSSTMSRLAAIKPVDAAILRKLPGGAYGLIAYSQPADYFLSYEEALKDMNAYKDFSEGLGEIEKEVGLSVKGDVLPALRGNLVLVVYPGETGAGFNPEMILYLDNANGADPKAVAERLRDFAARKSSDSGRPITFTEETHSKGTIWSTDPESARELQGMMSKTLGTDPSTTPKELQDKGVYHATVGDALIVASSRAMLNRALEAQNGQRTLADDPSFATMSSLAAEGSQGMLMVNLWRVMDGVRASMSKGESGAAPNPEDLALMFGGQDNGLVVSGKMSQSLTTGSAFVPLDYDRLAKVVAGKK